MGTNPTDFPSLNALFLHSRNWVRSLKMGIEKAGRSEVFAVDIVLPTRRVQTILCGRHPFLIEEKSKELDIVYIE